MRLGSAASPRLGLHALAAAAALVSVALGWAQIRATSASYDEPVHLASGFAGLSTGATSNWRDHPPLAEALDALPLLALSPAPPSGPDLGPALYATADAFLYRNRVDADRMLAAARAWSLLLWSAAVCWPLVFWAAELEGAPAAAAAAALAASCPALVSNAALVTTDSAAAALFFLACFFMSRRPRRRSRWALAGACAGLALAAKFSMIALPGLVAAALLAERLGGEEAPSPADLCLAGACALGALALGCAGRLGAYSEGLRLTLARLAGGRSTYAWGLYSTRGFWWYFPLAVLAKTPLPLLGLAAAGLAAAWRRPARWLWPLAPAAAFFLAACCSSTQIGLRHVLVVYPALILAASAAAAALWRRGLPGRALAAALLLVQAAGVLRAGPDLLCYFNAAAGGTDGGWRLFVDSNYDWGQGLKPLAAELHRRGDPPVRLAYFGLADPAYYGLRYRPAAWINIVRRAGTLPEDAPEPSLLAVSATDLAGLYFRDRALLSWLDPAKAVARPDPSIFLFDLSGDPSAQARAAHLRR